MVELAYDALADAWDQGVLRVGDKAKRLRPETQAAHQELSHLLGAGCLHQNKKKFFTFHI
jgi:hypothetical protein